MRKIVILFSLLVMVFLFQNLTTNIPEINVTKRAFEYKSGMTFPGLKKPIPYYLTKSEPVARCVPGSSSKECVPAYAFYALGNPYKKDPDTQGRMWFNDDISTSVTFWGGDGEENTNCNTNNMSVTSSSVEAPVMNTSFNKTGIVAGAGHLRWTPQKPKGIECQSDKQNGSSFVVMNEDATAGGIGLYTSCGKDVDNGFWQPFTAKGQGESHSNKYISGTFFSLYQKSIYNKLDNAIFPFSGNSNDFDLKRMVMQTNQSVHIAQTDGDPKTIAQVHQKVTMTFLNPECLKAKTVSPICYFNYLMFTYIDRREYQTNPSSGKMELMPTESFPWVQAATFKIDLAQKGLPYFQGSIKNKGQTTAVHFLNREYPIWKSYGAPTQFASASKAELDANGKLIPKFVNLDFQAEVSWNQFLTSLRILAASAYNKENTAARHPEEITMQYMNSKFGPSWNNPNGWIISNITVSHEAVDPSYKNEAVFIGGNVKSIKVSAFPH